MPIMFVNGDNDALSNIVTARATAESMKTDSLDVTFVEVKDGVHGNAWIISTGKIFDFFAAHSKKK